ncbi:MAG: YjjG family noncanonical pyrimidine nucleotidase [Flavobacteriales bacterium]|nr:YjjG family noncanonical pyrimidine nucleotidase [Flavobacteriales bacterium]
MPLLQVIKHIFFDLDKTLWDFETNSRNALEELYYHHQLPQYGVNDFNLFFKLYTQINDQCWDLYRKNIINKEYLRHQRFFLTLKKFGIENRQLAKAIGKDYVALSPTKTALVSGAKELLEHLKGRYHLHIITNGFEEIQYLKLKNTGIDHYFKEVITSERAGRRKPDPAIFQFAMKKTGAIPENSLMIGDDLEIDIQGARSNGWQTIWYNPHQKADPEGGMSVQQLQQLISMI